MSLAAILFSVFVWVVVEQIRIITGDFTDSEGNRITEWI